MLVSMLLPSRTAARLAPLPRCARITRPFAAAGSRRREFLHQIGVGQAVEAVALDALAPRSGAGSAAAWRRAAWCGETRCRSTPPGAAVGCRRENASISSISRGRCSGSYGVMRRSSASSFGVTRSGSECVMPWTTRCPTALTDAKTGCASSQSSRTPTAVRWSAAARRRETCGVPAGSLTIRFVPLRPMRSIFPSSRRRSVSPASYSANRMLDEPPLIVRIGLGFLHGSHVLILVLCQRQLDRAIPSIEIIAATGFARLPGESQRRRSAASLAPYSPLAGGPQARPRCRRSRPTRRPAGRTRFISCRTGAPPLTPSA